MAISGKKLMPFLGVFMSILVAVLLVVAAEGAVTVYNPARISAVSILVNDESLQVESGFLSIDVTEDEQVLNITTATGGIISMDVKNGDAVILLPEALVGNAPASVRVVPVPGEIGFSLPAGEPLGQP